jgi:hypothetical protein
MVGDLTENELHIVTKPLQAWQDCFRAELGTLCGPGQEV